MGRRRATKMGETSRTKLDFEELEFYTDLAMNECQRWLEAVTREPFSEPDDFLLSLRKGRQLQKLLNLLIPGAISIQQQHHKNDAPHSPKQRQLHRSHSDNKTWITKFLYICRSSLGLKEHQLFRISDLDPEKCSSIEGHSPADSVASDLILCKIRRTTCCLVLKFVNQLK
uniref:Calponin-homology (CH) domain-containing protein n=1 Tax=Romanomermis culicivorax TaxID=13658 RepID=A0A915L1D0_ROMCU